MAIKEMSIGENGEVRWVDVDSNTDIKDEEPIEDEINPYGDIKQNGYSDILSDDMVDSEKEYYEKRVVESSNVETQETVAGIIKNDKGEILVMRHFKLRLLTIPSGKVDPGESLGDALIRELYEEVGIKVTKFKKIDKLNIVYKFKDDTDRKHITIHLYEIEQYTGKPFNKEPNKHDNLHWVSPSKLKLTHQGKSEALKKTLEYLLEFRTYEIKKDELEHKKLKDNIDKISSDIKKTGKFPIFLVYNDSPNVFSKLIRWYTDSAFSHVGISLSSLNDIICFNAGTMTGLIREDFLSFLNRRKSDVIRIDVLLISKLSYERIINTLSYYFDNMHKTKYEFKLLPKLVLGFTMNKTNDLNLICSTFVANLIGGIEEINSTITGGMKNILLSPGAVLSNMKGQVVTLYEGSPLLLDGDIIKEVMIKSKTINELSKIQNAHLIKKHNLDNKKINRVTRFSIESVEDNTIGREEYDKLNAYDELSIHKYVLKFSTPNKQYL